MKNFKLFIAVGMSALTLSGCLSGKSNRPAIPSPNSQPIEISESVERLELHTRTNGLSLSERDANAVSEFVSNYGRYGDGPLIVNIPAPLAGGLGVHQAQSMLHQAMMRMGMPNKQVSIETYFPYIGAPAPVVVSYKRLKAEIQDCRTLGNMMSTASNRPYDGFGCAYHSNLAAMVGNPRQFLEPYSMGAPNAERRRVIYDKYIEGENPASAQPDRQENSSTEN
ncbi:MAG: CpaD family pilus assembly protein [Maricaulaceae bacterium]